MKLILNIDGMHCEHCISAVKTALEQRVTKTEGHSNIDVEIGKATIATGKQLPKATLIAAINAAGPFRVTGFETIDDESG